MALAPALHDLPAQLAQATTMSGTRSISRHLRVLSGAALLGLALLGVALLGSATSCGPLHRGEGEEEEQHAEIEFINESLYPADVYAVVSGSESIRIGSVMAGRREILRIPQQMIDRASALNIVARMLAHSRTASSGPLSIGRGERLQVRLPLSGPVLSVLPATQ
jgi:hypothetical protein